MVLSALKNRTPMNDSLKFFYASVFGNYQLNENTAAWTTLQSVGLDLISNDSLINAISHLYTVRYEYLENVEKGVDDNYQWNVMYPQVLEQINMDELWVSATPVNHEALMDNRKFQETLKLNLFFRNHMQGMYRDINDEVTVVRDKMENHIQALQKAK
ncbi:MAG: hypothetical protein ACJATS_001655 [Psychroserpens sp.]|jgi:hypothetical protein